MYELRHDFDVLISTINTENYQEKFSEGLKLLIHYKNLGGYQQDAYDYLSPLFIKYRDTDEIKSDLIADWLDYVIGWVAKGKEIWDSHDVRKVEDQYEL